MSTSSAKSAIHQLSPFRAHIHYKTGQRRIYATWRISLHCLAYSTMYMYSVHVCGVWSLCPQTQLHSLCLPRPFPRLFCVPDHCGISATVTLSLCLVLCICLSSFVLTSLYSLAVPLSSSTHTHESTEYNV